MSIGTMGVIRSSDVSIDDIDIYWNYTPNRQTSNNKFYKISNPNTLLSYNYLPTTDSNYLAAAGTNNNILEGLYNLKLPASTFNELGIYTIYIKPKVMPLTIIDCSVLSALPTVKGVLVNLSDLPTNLQTNNALQGYKIEYLNTDGSKLRNVARYVVTSNKVVPVSENVGNTSQKAIRYRFNDAGTLMFLQVSPSSSSDVKPNVQPFIGNIGGIMLLSNTNFSPIVLEIEMVENTIDTISDIIAGEQTKDVNNGILTYYDKDRVITKQFNLFQIKDDFTNESLFEVKEKRTNIDTTQNIDDIINV